MRPSPLRRSQGKPLSGLCSVAAVLACLGGAACDEPFPEPAATNYGDFGTEVQALLANEFLWSGTASEGAVRAEAFGRHKTDVVWALNALATGPVKTGMLPLFEDILPLYDDLPNGKPAALIAMTRDLSKLLESLSLDGPAIEALARMFAAPEANPHALEHLLGTLVRHPIRVMDRAAAMMLDLEPDMTGLVTWLHRELPTLEDATVVASNEKTFMQRLLSVEIQSSEAIGPPTGSVYFDGRGAPMVVKTPSGAFSAPFVDGDGDGQVDVDAYARPVDAAGAPIDLPTFAHAPTLTETRDQLGRAIIGGQLVYAYFDVRRSAVAWLVRDARSLLAKGLHFDLFAAFDALLGGRVSRDDADGRYTGFFVEESPLLELMHIVNELRRYPRLVELMRAMEHVVAAKEPLLRKLVVDLAKARKILHDAPGMKPGNSLFEDMHPILWDLVRTGCLRDMMRDMGMPGGELFFPSLATMMKSTALNFPSDMSLLATPSDVDALRFINPTPWGTPDTQDTQRSWLQKATYLIADTNRAPVIMRFLDRVDVPEVQITDNMANFYVHSVARDAWLDLGESLRYLEDIAVDLVPEFDDKNLDATEMNLYINHDQQMLGNPLGNLGIQERLLYGDALLALQTSGGLAGLRAWAADVVAKGQAQSLVELFEVLAHHFGETEWEQSGPNGYKFVSYGSGIRKVEPYLVEIVEDTQLTDHLLDLLVWGDTADFQLDGQTLNVADELDAFLAWMLDPGARVALRDGTFAIPGKRLATIENPSRMQLVLHAFDQISAALDQAPVAKAAWDRIDLAGVFLDLDGNGELANQHALDVIVALVPVLADQLAQSIAKPDWQEGIDSLDADLADMMKSRGFTSLVDTMRRVRDDPGHRAFVDELLTTALAEQPASADADVFGGVLQLFASYAQIRLDFDVASRLLRFLGKELDPARRLLFQPMETLQEIRALDPDGSVTTAMMANLLIEPEVGRTPLVALLSAFKAALRPDPTATGAFDANDLRVVMGKMADWLADEARGAERLFHVIKNR